MGIQKGGWLSEAIIPLFQEYTRVIVEALSDRVKWWIPMNEPGCFIMNAYLQGVHAPFRRDYLALSKLTRICMLAHGEAVKTVRKYAKQPVKVGMAFSTGAYVPDAETPEKSKRPGGSAWRMAAALWATAGGWIPFWPESLSGPMGSTPLPSGIWSRFTNHWILWV